VRAFLFLLSFLYLVFSSIALYLQSNERLFSFALFEAEILGIKEVKENSG